MSPEQTSSTPEQSTEHSPSYAAQLERDLAAAKTPIEKAGAVNLLLDTVLKDAENGDLRSVRTDRATGKDVETVYSKDQIETNFAALHKHLFGDPDDRLSYPVAERLMTRTGGLRSAMGKLVGENADPTVRAAAEVWLEHKRQEVEARRAGSTNEIDESLLETRPRNTLFEAAPAEEAPETVEMEASSEIGPEELEEIEEDMGEEAVKQLVEEPEASVEDAVEVEPEPESEPAVETPQDAESIEEAPSEEADAERAQARRVLDAQTEAVVRYEYMIANRIDSFLEDGQRLLMRVQSGDHSEGGVYTLIKRQIEQVPSMIAFTQHAKEELHRFQQTLSESPLLDEEAVQATKQTIARFEEAIDTASATLHAVDREFDTLADEARFGRPVDDQLMYGLNRVRVAQQQLQDIRLRAQLQNVLQY